MTSRCGLLQTTEHHDELVGNLVVYVTSHPYEPIPDPGPTESVWN